MTEFEKRLTKFIKIMESLHAQGVERINPKWAREQMQRLREAFSDEEADRPCPHCEGKGYFDFGMKQFGCGGVVCSGCNGTGVVVAEARDKENEK